MPTNYFDFIEREQLRMDREERLRFDEEELRSILPLDEKPKDEEERQSGSSSPARG